MPYRHPVTTGHGTALAYAGYPRSEITRGHLKMSSARPAKQDRFAKAAEGVAAAGRAIQRQVDRLEKQSSKAKGALITGADSGIGRAVAVLYAREGADVAVAYLNEHDDAAETKAAVEKEGRRCIVISGDVADPEFCQEAVKRTVKQFGRWTCSSTTPRFRNTSSISRT